MAYKLTKVTAAGWAGGLEGADDRCLNRGSLDATTDTISKLHGLLQADCRMAHRAHATLQILASILTSCMQHKRMAEHDVARLAIHFHDRRICTDSPVIGNATPALCQSAQFDAGQTFPGVTEIFGHKFVRTLE